VGSAASCDTFLVTEQAAELITATDQWPAKSHPRCKGRDHPAILAGPQSRAPLGRLAVARPVRREGPFHDPVADPVAEHAIYCQERSVNAGNRAFLLPPQD